MKFVTWALVGVLWWTVGVFFGVSVGVSFGVFVGVSVGGIPILKTKKLSSWNDSFLTVFIVHTDFSDKYSIPDQCAGTS